MPCSPPNTSRTGSAKGYVSQFFFSVARSPRIQRIEVTRRPLVPAELRAIALVPGDPALSPWPATAIASLVAAGAAVSAHLPWLTLLAPLAGGVIYFISRPSAEALASKPAAMVVCPWGIKGDRVVGWRDIAEISHRVVKETRGRTEYEYSILRVRIGDARFVGKCSNDSYLEALDALLPIYKEQSSLPLALELSRAPNRIAMDAKDAFHVLLTAARTYLASPPGRELTTQATSDYRGGARVVRPETVHLLSRVLIEKPLTYDAGPFAAVVAAELGVEETIDELLLLTMSPHPFVAAIARAAASRLGVHPSRSFPIHELTAFLGESEVDAMSAWAKETQRA